jgi:hypothetical protein
VTAVCVIPGCDRPSGHPGVPCAQCVADFGGHLRPADGPPLTAEQVAARDVAVADAYRQQLVIQATDESPGVCPDCYGDDHCGDDRCSCCEEAEYLGRDDDWDDFAEASEWDDDEDKNVAVGDARPTVTLQPAARYL